MGKAGVKRGVAEGADCFLVRSHRAEVERSWLRHGASDATSVCTWVRGGQRATGGGSLTYHIHLWNKMNINCRKEIHGISCSKLYKTGYPKMRNLRYCAARTRSFVVLVRFWFVVSSSGRRDRERRCLPVAPPFPPKIERMW